MNKQELIIKVASQYFKKRGIIPSEDYKEAVHRVVETLGFYDREKTNRTAVIPLETGQGKSSLIPLLLTELYKHDKSQSGSIILLSYRDQCNKLSKEINSLAGTEIAVAYHSKARVRRKELKRFPILIMTHYRFLSGIEELGAYACWKDFETLHEISNEPVEYMRKRLIVDESINKIELLPVSASTLDLLDNFFQEQRNSKDFKLWQNISSKIREMFVLPILPEARNKTISVKLDEEIPKRLIEVVKLRAKTVDKDNIQKAFKAVMNLSIDGGLLKTSSNRLYRKIQTSSYINVFSPLFTSIVLDGTARINATYQNSKYFDVLDIPRTKSYGDVTIHIESKANASRSAIEKDDTLVVRTMQYINKNLLNKNILLICHKNTVGRFQGLPENVSVVHWGAFNGSNNYNNKDCVVYCGVPHVDESYYVYLYHIFSGDRNYHKSRLYKPKGKSDPVVRFVNEPLYENMRQSYLAVEFVQSINRGVCRNYNNTIPMHCFLPYGDYETISKIEEELVGINIVDDYELLEDVILSDSKTKNKKQLVDVVVDVLLNHDEYFKTEKIVGKSDIFNLGYIRNNFKCESKAIQSSVWKSPEVNELQNLGYLEITKKFIRFLDITA